MPSTAQLRKTTSSITSEQVMAILPTLPHKIANEICPLIRVLDLETYKHFLVTMYHYTHFAEEQLVHASSLCEDPTLKQYFYQMSREEQNHYLIAKKDFEQFGGNVDDFPAPPSVKNFQDYWDNLGKENVNEFIGAMFVFENVATAVAKDIIDMMQRLNLTPRQSHWLRVHLEADVGHGDEALKMCDLYARDNPAAMLMAAEVGAEEWTAVFRYAFTKQI